MKRKIYKQGQMINGFVFLGITKPYISPKGKKYSNAKFKCHCGKIFITGLTSIVTNRVKSCGCIGRRKTIERNTTHNLRYHPIYSVWNGIKDRCYNKKSKDYRRYGGRGIAMCDEWINNPKSFIVWAKQNGYKPELTIDRINNDGDYGPNNCRFITRSRNSRFKSTTKLNWALVSEIRNVKLLIPSIKLKEIAEVYGVSQRHISRILLNQRWAI